MRATGQQSRFLVIIAFGMGTLISGYLFGFAPAMQQIGASTDNDSTATEGLVTTADMVAANGPLPGNLSLYATEVACSVAQNNTGYYSSLNGAEVGDAQRSETYPCAHFTGSFTDPSQNIVYAWRSEDDYQGASFVNNRNPGELYLTGGG